MPTKKSVDFRYRSVSQKNISHQKRDRKRRRNAKRETQKLAGFQILEATCSSSGLLEKN